MNEAYVKLICMALLLVAGVLNVLGLLANEVFVPIVAILIASMSKRVREEASRLTGEPLMKGIRNIRGKKK